jgi:hypothetical protein
MKGSDQPMALDALAGGARQRCSTLTAASVQVCQERRTYPRPEILTLVCNVRSRRPRSHLPGYRFLPAPAIVVDEAVA